VLQRGAWRVCERLVLHHERYMYTLRKCRRPTCCREHDAVPRTDWAVQLWASWPASSPWVTAVGGTRFAGGAAGGTAVEQIAVDQFGSGGGLFDHVLTIARRHLAISRSRGLHSNGRSKHTPTSRLYWLRSSCEGESRRLCTR
jgi:hypothetical protein